MRTKKVEVYRKHVIYYDPFYNEFRIVGHGNVYTRLTSARRGIDRLLARSM